MCRMCGEMLVMEKKQQKVFIQLGFMTDGHVGIPVAQEFTNAGLGEESTVFTLVKSMTNPEEKRELMNNAIVVTHSHGISAIDESTNPRKLVVVAGPEPKNSVRLMYAATVSAAKSVLKEQPSGEKRRVFFLDSLFAALAHPIETFREGLGVASYSTTSKLEQLLKTIDKSKIIVILMSEDRLFTYPPNYQQNIERLGVKVAVLDGEHNDLYENPKAVAPQIVELLNG